MSILFQSIRSKLLLSFLVVSLLPLIVSSFIIYNMSSSELVNKQKNAMRDLAVSKSQGMDEWLQRRRAEIELAAKTEIITSLNSQRQVRYAKQIKDQSDVYESVIFTAPDGWIRAHTTESAIGTLNLSDRDYFQNAMLGKTNYSDILVSKSTGNRIVAVATPVKNEAGAIIGVLSASMNLEALVNAYTKELSAANGTGDPILVDAFGKIQVAPKKEWIGKKVEEAALSPQLADILKAKATQPGVVSYQADGKEYVIANANIPQTGYRLYLNIPMDNVLQSSTKIQTTVWTVVCMAALLVALLAFWISRNISRPVGQIADQVTRVANGDLTVGELEIQNKDEIGALAANISVMIGNLKQILSQINRNSQQVAATAEGLSTIAEQTEQSASQMAVSIQAVADLTESHLSGTEESVQAMEEMAVGIQRIAESAALVAETSTEMAGDAQRGNQSIQQAVSQINSLGNSVNRSTEVVKLLGERSKEIGKILEVITEIASQTNLLALNAAIEAARAGEHGRGFAVVADEVRKLAEQSDSSAHQIAALIREIQADTERSVEAMETGTHEVEMGMKMVREAGNAFAKIVSASQKVAGQIQEVSAASEQMSASSEEVTASLEEMARSAKESAASSQSIAAGSEEQLAAVEEVAKSAQSLAGLAEDLKKLLTRFKL
ncbi:methyl-accepting chemotaxis protein [Effusibacillus dendaii]|uniref:Methyl-accepting chemotaxis sensory transducer n=1 Tax=Effusibacillus dendaii TaxID=2743772 RepID=A0A7I8DB18_9BACL|nr:methyl-accepting chemotaxis protein [Effusibacillus dendaii]BCJ87197.1 methyl-accepting chemotaxis sensory transducer [Effusibacillus dendaii]